MVVKNENKKLRKEVKPLSIKNVNTAVKRKLKGADEQDKRASSKSIKKDKRNLLKNNGLLQETLLNSVTRKVGGGTAGNYSKDQQRFNDNQTILGNTYPNNELGKNFTKKPINKTETVSLLNKRNLSDLQKEISQLETMEFSCEHDFCHHSHHISFADYGFIDEFRLWFLFDLEMVTEGPINLRNLCYQKFIYNKVDVAWTKSNILNHSDFGHANSSNYEDNLEYFPMEQLSLININNDINEANSESKQNKKGRRKLKGNLFPLDEMSVNIESMLASDQEDESTYETAFKKKIPSTILCKRHKKEIFDDVPIDINDLLASGDSSKGSSLLIEPVRNESKFEDREVIKDREKEKFKGLTRNIKKNGSCTLEKKVNTLEGRIIPKLTKNLKFHE